MSVTLDRKIVVVTRRTRLEELIARFNSAAQARFYLEHLGADFADYQRDFDTYRAARDRVMQAVAEVPRRKVMDRQFLPNFLFGPDDIVVALGQDGLVANTMKYLAGQPLVGVNPDPGRPSSTVHPEFRPISGGASSTGAGLRATTAKALWWHVCNSHPQT